MNKSNTASLSLKRYGIAITLAFATVLVVLALTVFSHSSSAADEITVYKSPTCGCCSKWVDHLEDSGFQVKAYNRNDMPGIKRQMGIAQPLQSCHTATVNGYVIEGHVPASDIQRLLKEKPAIHGLSVPGMPMGSPGMEGARKDNYDVLAIDKHGRTTVFSSH